MQRNNSNGDNLTLTITVEGMITNDIEQAKTTNYSQIDLTVKSDHVTPPIYEFTFQDHTDPAKKVHCQIRRPEIIELSKFLNRLLEQ